MRTPIQLQPTQTLREILAQSPGVYRLFEICDIDYYCGGEQAVADACRKSGYSLGELQTNLNHFLESGADDFRDLQWHTSSLRELTGYIVSNHHAYLRRKLPELLELAQKVAAIHAEDHPETADVVKTLAALKEALEPHMAKEEEKLFPLLCSVEDAAGGKGPGPAGSPLEKTLPLAFAAHHHNNGFLGDIRRLTNDFNPPEDACYSFQRLWKGLRELEKDMHRHLHLENNILFPRAQDYEKRRLAAWTRQQGA